MSDIKTSNIIIYDKNKRHLRVNYCLDDVSKINTVSLLVNGIAYTANFYTLTYAIIDLNFLQNNQVYNCQLSISYYGSGSGVSSITYYLLTEDGNKIITESDNNHLIKENGYSSIDTDDELYKITSSIFTITTKFVINKKEPIKIYESDETEFDHNGLGTLLPTSCIINRNLNDYEYNLDLTHKLDETKKWEKLKEDRIIKVNGQLFRIKHITKTLNEIKVFAEHLFFDLQNNFIEDTNIVDKNGLVAIEQLLQNTNYNHPFTGSSNITTIASSRMVRKNVVSALIGSDENSFINRWGGEIDMDWLSFNIDDRIGQDRGYKIAYGKNLTGLNAKFDMTNVVTRIRPVGFDGIELSDNKYVDSPLINNYAMPIIREYKYENVKWTGSPNYSSSNMIQNSNFEKNLDYDNDWELINDTTKVWRYSAPYLKLETTSPSGGIRQTIKTNIDKNYFVKIKMTLDDDAFASVSITQGTSVRWFNYDNYYDADSETLSFAFNSIYDGDTILSIFASDKYGTVGTNIIIYEVKMYDYDNNKEEEYVYTNINDARNKLIELAEKEFTDNQIDIPTTTYDINFKELSKTEEYKDYLALTLINIGDDVIIKHEKLGINIPARCIEYKYDCLMQEYDNITLGYYNKNFFSETSEATDKLNDVLQGIDSLPQQLNDYLQKAKDEATNLINNGFGG